ncbi:MAG: hypothetical protein CO105_07615 [Comamonadaceae bacterium CG_4_9_14_3_um_filter_60_33]|nr:MAG: hypothetical protein CO105_07615 [Comamonadaceae bacterium CG_4_9_14_3_um_filter_60_33]
MAGDAGQVIKVPEPGFAPAGEVLFFASPKKSTQKKGDPAVCDPQQNCQQPALGGFCGGVARTRCAQTIATPDPAKPTHRRRIQKGMGRKHPAPKASCCCAAHRARSWYLGAVIFGTPGESAAPA